MKILESYIAIGKACAQLFHPLVEIVIHDIDKNKIIFIEGQLSKRKIGDPSLIEINELDLNLIYSKINFDGKLIKSISVPIKMNNKLIALMCINFDISFFKEMHGVTSLLTTKKTYEKPNSLFKSDWQDKINEFIALEIQKKGKRFIDLTNKEKQSIIECLYLSGAFAEKKSPDYVAKVMDIGRATVFNYLKNFKKNQYES